MKYCKLIPFLFLIMSTTTSCEQGNKLTIAERKIIYDSPDSLLNIFTTDNKIEAPTLSIVSEDMTLSDIESEDFQTLTTRMIQTVQNPRNPGVGIAAPQIGINRRIIIVQRFDKEGEPFEAYANIYITEYSEETQSGKEGCLSVPIIYEDVTRSKSIKIKYIDTKTLKPVEERISEFTAIIFQHEIDHLEGILFTERI